MKRIAVVGIGTDVGKTLVSAILTHALEADFWKPIQCGMSRDRHRVEELLEGSCVTHPEAIYLKAPRSPHHAANLEGFKINPEQIKLPKTQRPLVIEGSGGIFVPLTPNLLMVDLFMRWDCQWIIVSRHYLGSINHTLLTLEALKQRACDIRGIIFNGDPCPQTESAILKFSNLGCIGRIKQEPQWNFNKICSYANKWNRQIAFHNAIKK